MTSKATVSTKLQAKTQKTVSIVKHGGSPTTSSRRISVKPANRAIAERVPIDDAGRIVVPAKIRKVLGIKGGQELTISLEDDVIKLQTVQVAIERAQAIARRKRKSSGSVVDEFIAERRAEATKE